MKCILNEKCEKKYKLFEISEEKTIVPGEIDNKKLHDVLTYFQYRAPNIDSLKSPLLEREYHDGLFQKMIANKMKYSLYDDIDNVRKNYSKFALDGDSICSGCKRFICARHSGNSRSAPGQKESDLECLLRHMRNALAHSSIYLAMESKKYNAILFEDNNLNGKSSARIVCCQADLMKWRTLLLKAVKEQEDRKKSISD